MSKQRVAVLKVVSGQLSVTAAAAEYGISRGHLHRLLHRYRDGGLDDLEPRSRRRPLQPARDIRGGARPDRRPADRAHRPGPGRGSGHHRLAPRARGPARPVDLDHPAHPPRRRPRGARAAQAAAQLLDPLRGLGAERGVAVGLHPLAPGRRGRGRDLLLARRPLPLPARLHRLPAGRRRRRGRHVHRGRRRPRLARRHAHRQRGGLHVPLHRGPQRLRVPARLPRHPPEERLARPPPDPGQDRALPPDPETLARAAACSDRPRGTPGPARRLPRASTTSSGPTGRSGGPRPARRIGRRPGRCPPAPARPGPTSASATTRRTARAP